MNSFGLTKDIRLFKTSCGKSWPSPDISAINLPMCCWPGWSTWGTTYIRSLKSMRLYLSEDPTSYEDEIPYIKANRPRPDMAIINYMRFVRCHVTWSYSMHRGIQVILVFPFLFHIFVSLLCEAATVLAEFTWALCFVKSFPKCLKFWWQPVKPKCSSSYIILILFIHERPGFVNLRLLSGLRMCVSTLPLSIFFKLFK